MRTHNPVLPSYYTTLVIVDPLPLHPCTSTLTPRVRGLCEWATLTLPPPVLGLPKPCCPAPGPPSKLYSCVELILIDSKRFLFKRYFSIAKILFSFAVCPNKTWPIIERDPIIRCIYMDTIRGCWNKDPGKSVRVIRIAIGFEYGENNKSNRARCDNDTVFWWEVIEVNFCHRPGLP
jgi:hypothetical protein